MQTVRADNWLRVGSGVALLLLLAAQEKVCPALLRAPRPVAQPADTPTGPSKPKKRAAPVLPHIVPDATAPRWPAAMSIQTAFRLALGDRDGTPAGGRQRLLVSDDLGVVVADSAPGGCRFDNRPAPDTVLPSPTIGTVPRDPALGASIDRRGPPAA